MAPSTPRRVLMIAPYFPPRRRVGALRPMRFAAHLPEQGWTPSVVCLATPGQEPTERERAVLERLDLLALGAPLDRTGRSATPKGDAGEGARRSSGPGPLAGVADVVDRAFPVDTWLPVLLAHLRTVHRFVRRVRPDVLWSTADPWSSHVLAMAVARRHGLPWVADFRDPWSLCRVRPRGRFALARAVDRRVERAVLRAADRVVFTAEGTAARYRRAFPDVAGRVVTIPNSYDADAFADPVEPPEAPVRAASPRPTLDLVFFGRFRALSPALPVARALAALRAMRPDLADAVRVRSTGPLTDEDRAAAEALGVADRFEAIDPVPYERALGVLRGADLLLLSTDPGRDEIIPAKLWDYLAAGRPVLSLAPNPEVTDVLEDTGAGVYAADADQAARLLAACADAKAAGEAFPFPYSPRPEVLRRYDARGTTEALARLLDEITRP